MSGPGLGRAGSGLGLCAAGWRSTAASVSAGRSAPGVEPATDQEGCLGGVARGWVGVKGDRLRGVGCIGCLPLCGAGRRRSWLGASAGTRAREGGGIEADWAGHASGDDRIDSRGTLGRRGAWRGRAVEASDVQRVGRSDVQCHAGNHTRGRVSPRDRPVRSACDNGVDESCQECSILARVEPCAFGGGMLWYTPGVVAPVQSRGPGTDVCDSQCPRRIPNNPTDRDRPRTPPAVRPGRGLR